MQSGKPAAGQQLPALTGLRFYLALWVVIHHLSGGARMLEPWVRNFPDPVQVFLRSGFWAVGTFFVLSGFVLARGYASASWDRASLIRYGAARVARIYPVYLVSLVIIAPIAYQDLFAAPSASVRGARAAMLLNYTFVWQGWTGTLPVQWNTPAWSLSCELFFYLCFPLVLLLTRCTNWRRSLVVAGAAVSLPVLLRLGGLPDTWKPLVHLGDFLLGIASAGVYDALLRFRPNLLGLGSRLYLPASALFVVLISAPRFVERWTPLDVLLRPLNALILLGLALGGGLVARVLSLRLSLLLGKASYAIYILHIPLLWWYKRSWVYHLAAPWPVPASVIFMAGVVAVSTLVYKLVEEPANRRLRSALVSWLSPPQPSARRVPAEATPVPQTCQGAEMSPAAEGPYTLGR